VTTLCDSLFEFAFGDEQEATDLLHHHLPPELARTLDWSTLRRLTAPTGRTLSPAELLRLASMRCWHALAKSPRVLRRCLDVWRDVLDELTTVSATSPVASDAGRGGRAADHQPRASGRGDSRRFCRCALCTLSRTPGPG